MGALFVTLIHSSALGNTNAQELAILSGQPATDWGTPFSFEGASFGAATARALPLTMVARSTPDFSADVMSVNSLVD